MGAIAGSWAGLHGPGEKTIEKTGQSGPGRDKGLGVWDRGPGERLRPPFPGEEAPGCLPGLAGKTMEHRHEVGRASGQGPEGSYSHSCQVGLSWGQTPIPGGQMQGAIGAPAPRRVPPWRDF